MGKFVILCWFVICCIELGISSEIKELRSFKEARRNTIKEYIQLVTNKLESIVDFFDSINIADLYLDAVIGLRIVEDELSAILRTQDVCTERSTFNEIMKKRLLQVFEKVQVIIDTALPIIKATSPGYFRNIGLLLTEVPWDADLADQTTDPELSRNHHTLFQEGEKLNEEQSDYCISQLLKKINNQPLEKTNICNISEKCWKMETVNGFSKYSLTHQVLYIAIGMKTGCVEHMDNLSLGTYGVHIGQLLQKMCSDVMNEALAITDNQFPRNLDDLFIEQIAVCGLAGFDDFYRPEWLDQIIAWHHPIGCFKRRDSNVGDDPSSVVDNVPIIRVKRHVRKKRMEQMMGDNCSGHKTAVASAAYVMYLRHLIIQLWSKC